MAFSFEKINSVCLCVCVCYLKSFIAELCIFLLHSSCINSSIIALYDEQLPPSSNQVPASWARLRCKFQVIAASHTLIHTHTHTGNVHMHARAYICGSSEEGLDFACLDCHTFFPRRMSSCWLSLPILLWLLRLLLLLLPLHLNAAHVLCRKFLSFKVFCEHLPHGLMLAAALKFRFL